MNNKMHVHESQVKPFENVSQDVIPDKHVTEWLAGMNAAKFQIENRTLTDSDTNWIEEP